MEVDGAGFIRPGRPSPPEARQAAGDLGVDLEGHRSRLLGAEDLSVPGTVVLVFEPVQRRRILEKTSVAGDRVYVLGDLDPSPIRRRRILDPVGRPVEVFRTVYRRTARCVDEALDALPLDVASRDDVTGGPLADTTGRSAGARS